MRLTAALILLTVSTGAAFAPAGLHNRADAVTALSSTRMSLERAAAPAEASVGPPVAVMDAVEEQVQQPVVEPQEKEETAPAIVDALSSAAIKARMEKQLAKMRQKDKSSPYLTRSQVQVLFDDENIVAVNKPSGVLSVCNTNPNMAQAVYDAFGSELANENKMVVHRLGMDTSGVMVFAKTKAAQRGLNECFRTRNVERTYEALVAGHMAQDAGMISLPLMRDYEFPPFMRVSTDDHQRQLLDLDVEVVGKKLLALPKDSLTKYEVLSREEYEGQPVTRVKLTSISGRTHQLNVHMAAFGHPIVGDSTYGWNGDAAPNGGLTPEEQDELVPNSSRASEECQRALASAKPCVHAKSIQFVHPNTGEKVCISTDAPF